MVADRSKLDKVIAKIKDILSGDTVAAKGSQTDIWMKNSVLCFQTYTFTMQLHCFLTSRRCAWLSILLGSERSGSGRFSSSASSNVHRLHCLK